VTETNRPLPRGRHGLSRDEVAHSQRDRLLRAVIDEVAEKTYAGTTAAGVFTRAGVSSRSFYEQFRDKQDCYLAAYDARVDRFLTATLEQIAATPPARSRPEHFERLLDSYLAGLASDPAFARAALVEIYAVGTVALQRRHAVQERLIDLARQVLWPPTTDPDEARRQHFDAEALVASITYLVTARVGDGRYAEIPDLTGPVVTLARRIARGPRAGRRRAVEGRDRSHLVAVTGMRNTFIYGCPPPCGGPPRPGATGGPRAVGPGDRPDREDRSVGSVGRRVAAMTSPPPRITPGRLGQIGPTAWLLSHAGGRLARSEPLTLFLVLGRQRRLFRGWLHFAGRLMPGGTLPRADAELVILRTAHLRGCDYEWRQHERIARRAGLDVEQIAQVRSAEPWPGWTDRQRALLDAVDGFDDQGRIGDAAWAALRDHLDEPAAVEFVLLAAHYAMLASAITALRITPEPPRTRLSR
jgi:AhpD family alkylhydroperoxidase